MVYLIKSLKWSRHYKKDTWWQPNDNGYTHYICNAGVYNEEDKARKQTGIEFKQIAFVPLTQKIIEKGKAQLEKDLKESKEELVNIRKQYERAMFNEEKNIDLINSKMKELEKFENIID